MATQRKLDAPPIIEAVIVLHFSRDPAIADEELRATSAALEAQGLGSRKEVITKSADLVLVASVPQVRVNEHEPRLDRIELKKETRFVHLKHDRIAVHCLAPYAEWEELETVMETVFAAIVQNCKPDSVSRISARYINRFDFGFAAIDMGEYFAVAELAPSDLATELRAVGFHNRLELFEEKKRISVITNFRTVPARDNPSLVLLLDIDVIKDNCKLAPTWEQVKPVLSDIRALKNKTFFSLTKDKALEGH